MSSSSFVYGGDKFWVSWRHRHHPSKFASINKLWIYPTMSILSFLSSQSWRFPFSLPAFLPSTTLLHLLISLRRPPITLRISNSAAAATAVFIERRYHLVLALGYQFRFVFLFTADGIWLTSFARLLINRKSGSSLTMEQQWLIILMLL